MTPPCSKYVSIPGKVFKEIIPPKNPALERLFSVAETTVFRSKTLDKKVPVEELFSNLSLTRGRNGVMKSKGRTNDGNEDVALPRTVQDAPRTGSLPPSQPTQQPTREEGNSQVMYIQRCQSESEALMHSCPPQLAEVNQTYLKQIEAFNLADQCNAGLPKLPKAQIKLSQVTEIPDRQKLLNVQDDQKNAAQNAKPEQNGQYYKIVDIDQNLQAGSKPETGEESEPRLSSPVKFSFDQSQYNNCLERKGRKDPAATAPRDEMLQALKRMKEKYNDALMEFASASPRNTEPHKASSGLPVGEEETEMAKKLPQAEARNAQTNEDTLKSELERLPVPRRNDAIHVFCVERENEKTKTFYRTFVATSYAAVWRAYLAAAAPTHLHWYEVIRENSACNLYFDLEYTLDDGLNAHVDGSGMVDILIRCVQRLMDRNWGVGFDPYSHVYELDSSTPSKFSRHLIIKLPGYAFYNNIAAGHFAAQVVEAAGNQIHVEKDEAKIPFVDIAVYTRNRHFRLPFSCKGGKTAVLRPTQRYACTPGAARPSPARIFLDSMICNVPVDAKLLLVQMPQQLENRSIGEMLSLSVNTNSFTLKNRAVTFTTKQPSSGRGKEWTAGRCGIDVTPDGQSL